VARAGSWVVLTILLLVVASSSVTSQSVPEIFLYVNDLTEPRTLLADEADALTDLCYEVDVLSTAEIAILIVNTTLPLGIDLFASDTFAANGIGKEGEDNGVLLLVSTDERRWRIEVGYGLEGILNDAKVGSIGRAELDPALAVEDFFTGIYNATLAIGQEIVDNYVPGTAANGPPALFVIDWPKVAITVVVFLVVAAFSRGRVLLWLGNVHRRGGFGGGRSGGGGARGRS